MESLIKTQVTSHCELNLCLNEPKTSLASEAALVTNGYSCPNYIAQVTGDFTVDLSVL